MKSIRWGGLAVLLVGGFVLWSGGEQGPGENLSLQYAEKKVELAELNLQTARALQQYRGISQDMLERVQSRLAVAEAQHALAFRGSTDASSQVQQKHAEERLRLAEHRLQALLANGSGTSVEQRRRELQRDLAQLHLDRLKQSRAAQTPMAYMQWQLDWLVDELISIDQRLSQLESQP